MNSLVGTGFYMFLGFDAKTLMVVISDRYCVERSVTSRVVFTNFGFCTVCVCDEHVERDQFTQQKDYETCHKKKVFAKEEYKQQREDSATNLIE